MTPPHYTDESVTLYAGDALDVLRTLPDQSVDAVVADPPAGIAFMGKAWDGAKGGREQWSAWLAAIMAEALRVTKPGGHALVWALPRTAHWTACGLEDAGWEIRDRITHLFGSGFPKSLDVGKAIDRQRDDRADVLAVTAAIRQLRDAAGLSNADLDGLFGFAGMAGHWTSVASQPAVPTVEQWARLRDVLGPPEWLDAEVWRLNGRKGQPGDAWDAREVLGTRKVVPGVAFTSTGPSELTVTAPATDAARRWDGWGTALKPAAEDWWLCRRPLEGTVAGNVTRWGTGAINVAACRVPTPNGEPAWEYPNGAGGHAFKFSDVPNGHDAKTGPAGRWPTNALLDTAAAAQLDLETGVTTSGSRKAGDYGLMGYMGADAAPMPAIVGDSGGASRFFPTFAPPDPLPAWRYEPKAAAFERPQSDGLSHPTVKSLDLVRWLCRLVTPPGGVILDCFAGSGTTGEAAVVEGFRAILVEREPAYLPLIVARLSKPIQPDLFGGIA